MNAVARPPLRTLFDCAARVPMPSLPGVDRACGRPVISIRGAAVHVSVHYLGLNRWEILRRVPADRIGHAAIVGEPHRSFRQNGPVRAREAVR